MKEEPETLTGRVEAENVWKRGDRDSVSRIVRANLDFHDKGRESSCHTENIVTAMFFLITLLLTSTIIIIKGI